MILTIRKTLEEYMKLGASNSGFYAFVLENGNYYDTTDDYDPMIDSLDIIQKACFRNSLLYSFVRGMNYVEGFYFTEGLEGLLLEHAWNVNSENNLAVDTTADKFQINVVSRFGVKVPQNVLNDYLGTNQAQTALQYYFTNYKKYNK